MSNAEESKNTKRNILIMLSSVIFIGLIIYFSSSLSANAPQYVEAWKNKSDNIALIRSKWGQGDYLDPRFTNIIDKNKVHFVVEIGSRDAIDAIDISKYYKAHVYAFECNPEALGICHHNQNGNPNVTMVPLAAWSETKSLTFYPVIPQSDRDFNIGASSLFKFDKNSPDKSNQGELTVQGTRMDEWLEKEKLLTPDLVCIDAQGATLPILKGFGQKLPEIKYIIAEAEYVRYYEGESMYPEITEFLKNNGFVEKAAINGPFFGNILFVNTRFL